MYSDLAIDVDVDVKLAEYDVALANCSLLR
jgi:hypothetical protein